MRIKAKKLIVNLTSSFNEAANLPIFAVKGVSFEQLAGVCHELLRKPNGVLEGQT